MKPASLFAVFVGVLAGVGGVTLTHLQSAPYARVPDAPSLALDTPASGELTSRSPLNLSDGRRSEAFELQAPAGHVVSLSTSGPLQSQISVLRDGRLIARSTLCEDCSTESPAPRRGATLGFRADHAGSYLIAVSGATPYDYGPFKLTAQAVAAYSGEPLQAGQSLTDIATGGLKAYRLSIAQDGLYSLTLTTAQPDMPPLLRLIGPGPRTDRLQLEDDSGAESQEAHLQAYLTAGSYILHATASSGNHTFQGPFTLNVKQDELPKNLDLKDGAQLSLDKGRYTGLMTGAEQNFHITLEKPTLVSIDMTMRNAFQIGPHESSISSADGLSQSLTAILQAGAHTITVPKSSQGGLVTLTLTGEPPPADMGGGPLAVGQLRQATMPTGVRRDIYTLSIEQEGDYLIDMRSDVFDTYLSLSRDGQEIYQDDDSGGDYNARLEVFLVPGEYQLHAVNVDGSATPGAYELLVSPN